MDSRGTIFCRGSPATSQFRDSLPRPRQYGPLADELRDGERAHRPNQLLRSFRAGDNDGIEFGHNSGAAVSPFDYGGETFSHWSDGTTNIFHTVTLGSISITFSLTAVYTP